MPVKYVFVTGGVVSGLGKGITAASLGRLLKARGYKVTSQKFDPYINMDPAFLTKNAAEISVDILYRLSHTLPTRSRAVSITMKTLLRRK